MSITAVLSSKNKEEAKTICNRLKNTNGKNVWEPFNVEKKHVQTHSKPLGSSL